MNLKNLNDDNLIQDTTRAVACERESTVSLLKHFREIESRRLYAKRGFASMFEMAIKFFGLSEGAAARRVAAMRLLKDMPEAEEQLESGKLTLSTAAQVHAFCRKSKLSTRDVLPKVQGKSARQVEVEFAKMAPQVAPREKVKQINENQAAFTLVISNELREQLDNLKSLRAHANPEMPYAELIKQLAELGEKHWSPAAPKRQRTPTTTSVGIGAQTKREVWRRDNNQCTYRDPVTKQKCDSRHLLQLDHIHPRALGGSNDAQNLRLLCRQHNLLAAEIFFRKTSEARQNY